jgi:RNA polymerase-binding transcription factor DksA
LIGMTGVTPRDRLLAEFRDRLAGARLNLARTVATSEADLEALAAHGSREIAEDPTTGTVGDLLSRLRDRDRQQLDEIDAAQARLEDGGFGICERCRDAIHLKRLRATPTARYCGSCEDQSEAE